MENNIIRFNSYKLERGGSLYDMCDQFNARVGDQGTPLVMQWTQGLADTLIDLQAKKLHFYAAGQVGQYLEKLKDGTGYQMSADASQVEYEDRNAAGTMDHGITKVKLPKQFFPQEGIFYGYFGLKDDQGNTYTSVNVWFRVLGGVPIMGAAIPYFSTRFDELMETFQGRIEDVLAQLRQEYQDEVKKNQDMSAETRAALSKLADAVGAIQAQINAGNVVTLIQHNHDYRSLASMIENKLAQMNMTPEAFPTADAIKEAYPNGKIGIFIANDTGHKWIYYNGWQDAGIYQTTGLSEKQQKQLSSTFLDVIVIDKNSVAKNDTLSANELENGAYFLGIDARNDDEEVGKYAKMLNYPPVNSLVYGVMQTYRIGDSTGAVQQFVTNDDLWQRYELNNAWSNWNRISNEYKATIIVNDMSSTEDANKLTTGEYYLAVGADTAEATTYFHDKLHFPNISGLELGRFSVIKNQANDGGSQVFFTDKNVYTRSESAGKWSEWVQLKDTKRTDFTSTLVLNGNNLSDKNNDANTLANGVYFLAIDGSNSDEARVIANNLHYPLVNKLVVGSLYSQVNDKDHSGTQMYICQDSIYIRSHAGVLNSGEWTDWKNVGSHNVTDANGYSNNRAVFFGDSRMAGLLANGKGYADPLPYQAISNINHYQATGNATSGTGFVFTIDGTNAVTEAQRHNFNDFEIAVFAYGINDYMQNQELGELGDSEDSNTVMGAMLKATKAVYKSNPDCSLIFVLPFLSANFGTESTRYALDQKNNAQTPYTLQEMQDKMAAFCEKYAIPYVDTRKGCPINPLNVEQMLGDKVHPVSTKEYDVYIQWLAGRLDSLIKAINY
ncbi:GDSL-type esterase/lipase family protein [Limosilactobacillus reuteri]|uniref:GDSL-type esterase/lipase family protein n=1 Tax=Limosilactobacillus reuteri TaxID=1598 RepID=UPI001E2DFCF6|nr:GDSL-type esterase/lipase family protein [Limosilactobacillus reuteri]MCC4440127.1 hypothetical protein [Limosilactobacillus reuteri]